MRKLLFYLSIFAFISTACDRVENPIPNDLGNYDVTLFPGNYATEYSYPSFGANTNSNVNVLIEDYTGHKCGNCPQGAMVAKALEDANPSRIIAISEHAGAGGVSQFQRVNTPDDNDYPKYSRDFTNVAGLTYAVDIDGLPGNPYGMINRRPISGSSSLWIPHGQWQQYSDAILQENNLRADIQLIANYYPENNAIFVHAEAESKTALEGNYNLVIYAVAKEITDWQKNYTVFPNDIEEYKHHNVHIGNINGVWGEAVFQGSTVTGVKSRVDYTYVIPEQFRGFEYAVLAYVMDASTYEILQVVMVDA